jgi:beta-glucanase (GH16 family)
MSRSTKNNSRRPVRQATRKKSTRRQPRRILGLRWHHVSGLAILGIGLATFLIAQPYAKSSASASPLSIGSASSPSGYSLAWSDEFNGSSVDSSKWNELSNSNYGSANHEDECYEPGNITESGGTLNILAQQQTVTCGGTNPDTNNDNYFFTSGFLTSRANGSEPQKYSFQYGYVESAIEMPKGNPYWGAFWLVGDNTAPGWPQYGEFDINEMVSIHPDATTGTIHYPCSGASNCSNNGANLYNMNPAAGTSNTYDSNANLGTALTTANYGTYTGKTSSSFVRYGFLWQPNLITWYINGIPNHSLDSSGVLTTYTSWDSSGNPLASTTKTLTASTTPLATVFSYYHTIDLNLSVGGASPTDQGYTGKEDADGTSYDDGNLTTAGVPGVMKVDYVRVYQPSATPPADTTAPTVSLTSPSNGVTSSGTITVSGSASDNVGVKSVSLYVDGASVASDTTSPYSFSLDTSHYSDSTHSLQLKASDAANNVGSSATVTITIKNQTATTPSPPSSPDPSSGSGGSTGTGSGSSPTGTTTTLNVGGTSSTPVAVKGKLVIMPATPGSTVDVSIDGKTMTGDVINTNKLTNGTHVVTVTENGKTVQQKIVVHNPLPTAIANQIQANRVAYTAASSVTVIAIGALLWLFRRRISLWLLKHIRMKYLAYFGISEPIKLGLRRSPTKKPTRR